MPWWSRKVPDLADGRLTCTLHAVTHMKDIPAVLLPAGPGRPSLLPLLAY